MKEEFKNNCTENKENLNQKSQENKENQEEQNNQRIKPSDTDAKNPKTTYENVIVKIAENYRNIERSLVEQLLLEVPHPTTIGSYRETVWKSLFEMIIPKKYCIEQGVFIIDSYGEISAEVDLAIYDETYTPYIFNYGKLKFIPIEAVAAVVQCKSREKKRKCILKWVETINQLKTSLDSMARMAARLSDGWQVKEKSVTQTATRPIKILCGIKIPSNKGLEDEFDIILRIDKEKKRIDKYISNQNSTLSDWNEWLNHNHSKYDGEDRKFREIIKADKEQSEISILDKQEVVNGQENQKEDEEQKKFNSRMAVYHYKSRELSQLAVRYNTIETDKTQKNCSSIGDKKVEEENVILSLTFQLNQLLMLLNNPMLFPHRAYAERFAQILDALSMQTKGENNGTTT